MPMEPKKFNPMHQGEKGAHFSFSVSFLFNVKFDSLLYQYKKDEVMTLSLFAIDGARISIRLTSMTDDQFFISRQGGLKEGETLAATITHDGEKMSLYINGKEIPLDANLPIQAPQPAPQIMTLHHRKDQFSSQESFSNSVLSQENVNVQHADMLTNMVTSASMLDTRLMINNESAVDLILCPSGNNLPSCFPNVIPKGEKVSFSFKSSTGESSIAARYEAKENTDIWLEIRLTIPQERNNTTLDVEISPYLQKDIDTSQSIYKKGELTSFIANLYIADNLVISNSLLFRRYIVELGNKIGKEKLLSRGLGLDANLSDHQQLTQQEQDYQFVAFSEQAQIFNRRIQKVPAVIVLCQTEDDVREAFALAKEKKLPISIRSGGHDHEGECSGTNTVLLDLMGLDRYEFDPTTKRVKVGPGNRFEVLTTKLARDGVMIPHGTCATVAIPGFIMGGGWGPWTRAHGMCCESLVAAKVILGDGQVETVSLHNKPELLWALKGGGGLSYGIVIEFEIQTFDLPPSLIKFELEWNPYQTESNGTGIELSEQHPTLKILQCWEQVITGQHCELIGTNLKINGKYGDAESPNSMKTKNFNVSNIKHNCVMYGYWAGTKAALDAFIKACFIPQPDAIRIDGVAGLGHDYGKQLMSAWDRESFDQTKALQNGHQSAPLPPDLDQPAPHKITSRLVDPDWLSDNKAPHAGYTELLQSLTSPLIGTKNREKGLYCYVTLGAITGPYYQDSDNQQKSANLFSGSAFPYEDKLYTIQYQTWWNESLANKVKGQDNFVYTRVNRAMDWIEEARKCFIPHTSGAFISFKDASIPTSVYFDKNYTQLVNVKKEYVQDPYNYLRKRKTII